jgi:DNA polymerase III subunit epsilon
MILFFDTETDGLAKFSLPDTDPSQPNLVQLALLLCEDDGTERFSFSTIVKLTSIIPEKASSIHGITTEIATHYGLSLSMVMGLFQMCAIQATGFVAHNFRFDKIIVNRALHKCKLPPINHEIGFCTMLSSTSLCKLPGTRGYKWPKLQEVYQFLFNETFDGAHSAMEDVRACKRVFFELVRIGHIKSGEATRLHQRGTSGSPEPLPKIETLPDNGEIIKEVIDESNWKLNLAFDKATPLKTVSESDYKPLNIGPPPIDKNTYWCETHKREATALNEDGSRRCEPSLSGITAPCRVISWPKINEMPKEPKIYHPD